MQKTISLLKKSPIEYFSIIIFSLGITLLSFIQIYFHEVFKYSVMQASMLLGAATLGQFLGSIFSRKCVNLVERILNQLDNQICSMRLSISILAIFIGILLIGFNLNHVYSGFIILSFLLGVALAIFSPINMVLLTAKTSLEETVIVTFLRRWTLNIGSCIAFGLMGYLVSNPHQMFYTVATIFICIGIFELLRIFKTSTNHEIKAGGICNLSLTNNSQLVWMWLIGVFFSYVIFFQTISTYPIFLKDYVNIDASHFSRLMLINVIMMIGFQFIAPIIEKRISISNISAIGTLLIGIGLAITAINSYGVVIASIIIWSIGEIFLLGVTPVYAKLFAGNNKERNLQYSSNYYAACYLGKILGPLVFSYCYSSFAMHKSLLLLLLLLSVLVAICFYSLGRKVKGCNHE